MDVMEKTASEKRLTPPFLWSDAGIASTAIQRTITATIQWVPALR